MATPSKFKTLGELYDEPSEDEILGRIKVAASKYLPEGWVSWKVRDDHDRELDPATLNKLRFCLPAIEIAKAFNPEARSLKERPYRDMKVKMFTWPFCRGLLLGPPSLALHLRGSALHCELISQSVKSIDSVYMTRKEASKLLGDTSESASEESSQLSYPSRKVPTKVDRIEALEEESRATRSLLQEILNRMDGKVEENRSEEDIGASDMDEEMDEEEQEDFIEGSENNSFSWSAPAIVTPRAQASFDFSPKTKEQEPSIPEPNAEIKLQGISCQRLGESSWNKIRYADVLKKLHASPVFSSLSVNAQLKHLLPSNPHSDFLERTEGSYGTISHGLLLQRSAFQTALNKILEACPDAAKTITAELTGENSAFRECSDNLLQYVCGKRAETIEMRRKLLSPLTPNAVLALNKIPPSESALFDDSKVEELLKMQGFNLRPLKRKYPLARQETRSQKYPRKPVKKPHYNKDRQKLSKNIPSTSYASSKDDKSFKSRGMASRRF